MNDAIVFKASKPDSRVWLFLVMIVSLLTFFCGSRIELFSLFAILAVVMAWQKMIATAKYFVSFYALLLVLNACLGLISIPLISMVAGMVILLLFKLIPIYMAYSILVEKTAMNELIVALEQLRVPKMLIIPLTVVYRYIPTVRYEIAHINESLKMRGLEPSFVGMVLHPVTTIEKFMIPLLVRSSKLADELSAAALCKGLDAMHPRTSCARVRFDKQDAICCVIFAVVALTFIVMHNQLFIA